MSDIEINADDFVANVQKGDFRSAIASVMGQNPKGINLTKSLLIKFNKLNSEHKESILAWSVLPAEQLPINDRWYVEQIARHEMAHIVVAKALDFNTGKATLVLKSPDGSHEGTSVINTEFPTPSLSDVSNYLDRRVMILLAGYLAEPTEANARQNSTYEIVSTKIAESDLQKARELIRVKLNIEGMLHPSAAHENLHALVQRALAIVEANFKIISTLAKRFSEKMEFYGQGIGWEGWEIDQQPEIQQIVKA